MSAPKEYVAFGFKSTHRALRGEDALRVEQIPMRVIPRPTSFGLAECGVAIRVDVEHEQRAREAFSAHGVEPVISAHILDV